MVIFKSGKQWVIFDPGTTCSILANAVTGHILDPSSLGINTKATISRLNGFRPFNKNNSIFIRKDYITSSQMPEKVKAIF